MKLNFYNIAAAILLSCPSMAYAIDPCSFAGQHGTGMVVKENSIKDLGNGFNYELWRHESTKGYMKVYGGDEDCAFTARWDNSGDFIARVGYFWGKEEASPKYTDLDGDIHAEYKFSVSKGSTSNDYSFMGIYGWTKSPNTVEYYIVDDSFNRMTTPWNTEYVGKVTVDGATYNIYSGKRTNAPSIYDYSDFTQVFSIRQGGTRQCGHISITEHFKAWEKLGIKMGELYDCKFFIETGGLSGEIDFQHATMWIGDEQGPFIKEDKEPFKEMVIPGIVEMEDYDKGGQGVSYYDLDKENKGELYRNDRVDVVESPTGYAIGYTQKGEWLEYTVDVESDGDYIVEASMAHGDSDPKILLSVDGDSACALSCKGQGDWDTYAMAKGSIKLSEGTHVLRVEIATSYSNIDFIKFSKDIPDSYDNALAEEITVTPNPATEYVEIKGKNIIQTELYDVMGNKLISTEYGTLDLSMLSNGSYILRISTTNGIETRKLTVKK